MNSLKIKCKESGLSFGKFSNEYPNELYGNIEKTEFENLINNLNTSCKKTFNKLNLLWLIGPIAGIVLIILGIVKWRKSTEEEIDDFNYSTNGYSSSYNTNTGYSSSYNTNTGFTTYGYTTTGFPQYTTTNRFSTTSSFSSFSSYYNSQLQPQQESNLQVNNLNNMNFNSAESYKPDKPLFYFVMGIGLFLLGFIIFSISYCVYKSKVLNKIEEELIPINARYAHKRISFSLESFQEDEYIPEWEYNTHKNNRAYMNDVKFDKDGKPYKIVEVHYLVITYPVTPVIQNNNQFSPLPPNYTEITISEQQQQQQNMIPMETL